MMDFHSPSPGVKRGGRGEGASRTLSLRGNMPLRRLSVAQFVALAATYAIYFASMALVEEKTHSSAQMGLMIFSSTLPGFLFGMLAGVVVDRHDRRRVLVIGNLLRLLVAAGFAAAAHWLSNPLPLLTAVYACNFLLSAIAQFTTSAEGSLIPHTVPQERLLAANSIFQVATLGAQGAGMVLLAPTLLRLGGAPAAGVAAMPLFALAGWMCARLPAQLGKGGREQALRTWASLRDDLRAGWRFVAGDASVRQAIGCQVLVSALSLVLTTLIPGLATRTWGVPVEYVAYLAVPGGFGFGLGVWLVGQRGHVLKEKAWISAGLLAVGGGLALLPALHALRGLYVPLFLLVSAVVGAGFALVIVPARTVVQERSPDEMRGRVISTQMFLSNIVSTLPLPLTGGLADLIGLRRIFALLALVVLSIGAASVRHARG